MKHFFILFFCCFIFPISTSVMQHAAAEDAYTLYPARTFNPDATPITIGLEQDIPAIEYLPIIAALEYGGFERVNLAPTLKVFDDNRQMADALANEEIDFLISRALVPSIAIEYDHPIRVLGMLTQGSAAYSYARDPTYTDIKDLSIFIGEKILLPPDNRPISYHLTRLMRENPTTLGRIKIEFAPLHMHHQLMRGERAKIGFGYLPHVNKILRLEPFHPSFSLDTIMGPMAHVVISGNIERLSRNTFIRDKVIQVIQDSLITVRGDAAVGTALLERSYPEVDRVDLLEAVTDMLKRDAYPANTTIVPDLWERTYLGLLNSGYLLERHGFEDIVFLPESDTSSDINTND